MSSPPPLTRRFTIALTAAVASTTIAIGVTAASLLGWLRPVDPPAAAAPPAAAPAAPTPASPMIFVPISPATPVPPAAAPLVDDGPVQLVMHERDHDHDDEDDHDHDEHEHERDDD